jgi:hypothetical protein
MPSLRRGHFGPPKSSKTNQKYRAGSSILLLIHPVPRLFMLFCYPPWNTWVSFMNVHCTLHAAMVRPGLCGQGM